MFCPVCGTTFVRTAVHRRYCSPVCRAEAQHRLRWVHPERAFRDAPRGNAGDFVAGPLPCDAGHAPVPYGTLN